MENYNITLNVRKMETDERLVSPEAPDVADATGLETDNHHHHVLNDHTSLGETAQLSSSPKPEILPLMSLLLTERGSSHQLADAITPKRDVSPGPGGIHGQGGNRDCRQLMASSPIKADATAVGYRHSSPAVNGPRLVLLQDGGRRVDSPANDMVSRSPSRRGSSPATRDRRHDHSPRGRFSQMAERDRQSHLTPLLSSARLPRGGVKGEGGRASPASSSPMTSSRHLKLQPIIRAVEKTNLDEAQEIAASISPRYHADLVYELINAAVETCFRTRRKIGKFLMTLMERNVLRSGNVRGGLTRFMEIAEDVEVDVPRLWFNLGQIFAPLLSDDQIFPPRYLEESIETMTNAEKTGVCVLEVVKEALEIYGRETVVAYWDASAFAQKWISKGGLKGLLA